MDEYIEILNDKGEISGKVCKKSEAHKKGLFHASVHIWIIDQDKNVLIQNNFITDNNFGEISFFQI